VVVAWAEFGVEDKKRRKKRKEGIVYSLIAEGFEREY